MSDVLINGNGGGVQSAPVIFEFDGKGNDVQEIEMLMLNRSIRRESGLAGIRSIPVQFWKLFASILVMIEEADLNYERKPIWVQNNSSKAYLTDEEKKAGFTQKRAPINRWRFDKIISTIQLPNIVEGQNEGVANARNAAIGLTLNKEGLTVAFGMNVHACTNFNVLGGTIMRSYGSATRDSMSWELMEIRLKTWIQNINQIWSVQNDIMNIMKGREIHSENAIYDVIGGLYEGAIRQAYLKGDPMPFNTHELSHFVRESILQRDEEEKLSTVWDLYNWGTSIMKPGIVDIGEIADNSNMWADYLLKRFELDYTSYEEVVEGEE